MRKVIFTTIFVLILSLVSFAQQNEISPCPTIEIDGRLTEGNIRLGEQINIDANVGNLDWKNLTYNWKLSENILFEGQGNPFIYFTATERMQDLNLKATVEIGGLPKNCENIASEKFNIQMNAGSPYMVDEYRRISISEEKSRLDNIASKQKEIKNGLALFFFKYTENDDLKALKKRLLLVEDYLVQKARIPKDKFKFVFAEMNIYQTVVYLMPSNHYPKIATNWKEEIDEAINSNKTLPCPEGVTVDGPAGTTNPGELQTFTAKVTGGENHQLKYVWSVQGGTLVDGQGTDKVKVLQLEELIGDNLTTTVEVQSYSEDCGTVSASEVVPIYCPPSSFVVDEISSSTLDKERLTYFALTLQNAPNASGHILGKFKKGTSESLLKDELRKMVIFLVKERDIDESNITIKTVETDEETTIQFWIVPAGAIFPESDKILSNSSVKETNESVACPTITIQQPTKFLDPGEMMQFVAKIDGEKGKYDPTFLWTVENGRIIKGQGTTAIEVISDMDDIKVSATLSIRGLPDSCETKFLGNAMVFMTKDPVPIDSFGKISFEEEKDFINAFLVALTNNRKSLGVYVLYLTDESKVKDLKNRISKIQKYIAGFKNFQKDRIEFIVAKSDSYKTELHVLSAGQSMPEIKNQITIN